MVTARLASVKAPIDGKIAFSPIGPGASVAANQQIAEINRQMSVMTAEAKQKAQALTASATSQKSMDVIQLDNMEAAIDRWDGHVSPLSSDGKQTIVIGSGALNLGNDDEPQARKRR